MNKYIKVNLTINYCYNEDEELNPDNLNVDAIQGKMNWDHFIDFFPDEGDTCVVHSVELINE